MANSTITIPKKVLKDLFKASEEFERAQDELEDCIYVKDPDFLRRMRQYRKEHQRKSFSNWKDLKKRYGV